MSPMNSARMSPALAKRAAIGPSMLALYDMTTSRTKSTRKTNYAQLAFLRNVDSTPTSPSAYLLMPRGLPLSISAFEGIRAEAHTTLQMPQLLAKAYNMDEISIVAYVGIFMS